MKKGVMVFCENCGSPTVYRDASAAWNSDTCEWELSGTYDSATCTRCNDDTRLDDVELTRELMAGVIVRNWYAALEQGGCTNASALDALMHDYYVVSMPYADLKREFDNAIDSVGSVDVDYRKIKAGEGLWKFGA